MRARRGPALGLFALWLCASCGGGGGGSGESGSNVVPISVSAGPAGSYPDGIFTSVTVCIPGTSSCQTIAGVLVDTGSTGLRILGSALTLALPHQADAGGGTIAECATFVDSITWGPVAMADVKLGAEVAARASVQVIAPSGFPAPPADCVSSGMPPEDTLDSLGANGVLGIGLSALDCGEPCASSGPDNPGNYYSCSSGACSVTTEDPALQIQNPVVLLPQDNNGVLVDLPGVGPNGAPTVSGSLVFGIGTQSNNALGSATLLTTNDSGDFTTTFNGQNFTDSFIDSGSNGFFFLTAAQTGLADCSDPNDSGFYCPPSATTFDVTLTGTNGVSKDLSFEVIDAQQLFATNDSAFDDLAGSSAGEFDFGAPFFLGRRVFVAIAGQPTPAGPGPYWAY